MTRRLALRLLVSGLAASWATSAFAADSDVRIALAGAGKGSARYRNRGGVRELQVEAENLRVLPGTILLVAVNGGPVGTMVVTPLRTARLALSTQLRQTVPIIGVGAVVTVLAPNGAILLTGRF